MATKKKTVPRTPHTVEAATTFIAGLPDDVRADCERLDALMQAATGDAGVVWAGGIVGYGRRVLRYASGRELDWMKVAFSARKTGLSLYLHEGIEATSTQALLQRLGKHKTGKGCLIIKRLADVDERVLQELIEAQVAFAS
jgi:hypothetical protein